MTNPKNIWTREEFPLPYPKKQPSESSPAQTVEAVFSNPFWNRCHLPSAHLHRPHT